MFLYKIPFFHQVQYILTYVHTVYMSTSIYKEGGGILKNCLIATGSLKGEKNTAFVTF
jgi:hypothetical protein